MDQILGKQLLDLKRQSFLLLCERHSSIWIDLGCGDGKFLYRQAKQHAQTLFIGVEPAWENVQEISAKALKKPSRGGVSNLLFVRASFEALPLELQGLANTLSVNYPWGSLLKAIAAPDYESVLHLARLLKPAAALLIALNLQVFEDAAQRQSLALPELSDAYIEKHIISCFLSAGFKLSSMRRSDGPSEVHSTWGRRLTKGSARRTLHLDFIKT